MMTRYRRLLLLTFFVLAAAVVPTLAGAATHHAPKAPRTPELTALVPVAGVPTNPVATPSYVYVASDAPSVITLINAHTHRVAATIPTIPKSFAIVISPNLSTIYVASTLAVSTFSTSSNRVTATLRLPRVTEIAALADGDAAVLYKGGSALGTISPSGSLSYHRTLKTPAKYLAASSSVFVLSFHSPKNSSLSAFSEALTPLRTMGTARGATGLVATALGVFVPNVAKKSVFVFSTSLSPERTLQVNDPQLVTTNGNTVFVSNPTRLYEYANSYLAASTPLKAPLISMLFAGSKLYATSFAPQSSLITFTTSSLKVTARLTLALATGQATSVPGSDLVYISNHAGLVADVTLN
jgi:hypothetical protein